MLRALLVALAAVVLIVTFVPRSPMLMRSHASGELAPSEPAQGDIGTSAPWKLGKHQITPLAAYDITALVISTASYWFGQEAEISPIDFAVGWGPMSDRSVIDRFSFNHGHRMLSYQCGDGKLELTCSEINSHSANMHLIPANGEVNSALKSVRAGETVTLSGYLVRVDSPGGYRWVSSLSRTDGGMGACELMWVEQVSTR